MNFKNNLYAKIAVAVVLCLFWLQHFVLHGFQPVIAFSLLVLCALLAALFIRAHQKQKKTRELLEEQNRSLEEMKIKLSVQLKQVEVGEKALRRSEQQFRILAEQASPGIVVIQRGRVLFANEGLSELCGYTVDEIMAWEPGGFAKVIAPEDLPVIVEHNRMMEAGEAEGIQQATVNIITKGGLRRSLQYFARTIDWYGNNANLLSFVDISPVCEDGSATKAEKEKLETMLRGRTMELERANRELESFAYSVSHDLRAPLRAVSGFGRALDQDFGTLLPEEGKRYLFRLRGAADYMEQLIDAFLRLSRISRSELKRTSLDIGLMASNIMEAIQQDNKDRKISFSVSGEMVEFADETLFRVVLENLLNNAVKYTKNRKESVISFNKITQNGEKVYCITDNGAGFDMHYSSKLFMPFQRLHKQNDFEGVGIGLAIAQRIIARHGGRIWAHAEIDRGASFFFTVSSRE